MRVVDGSVQDGTDESDEDGGEDEEDDGAEMQLESDRVTG